MSQRIDQILNFIYNNRLKKVLIYWAAVVAVSGLIALVVTNLLLDPEVRVGLIDAFIGLVVGLGISLGIYAVVAYLLSLILSNGKTLQKRNTFKALLVYRMGSAVIDLVTLPFLLLGGGSSSQVGLAGGYLVYAGVTMLLGLLWTMVMTSVIAKIYSISWLKGCLGLVLSAIILAVVVAILGVIGLGSVLSLGGVVGFGR